LNIGRGGKEGEGDPERRRDGDRQRGLHPVSPDEGLFKNRL